MALPACELRLATDVVVEADGSGQLELLVAIDQELAELLGDAGVDPLRGLTELRDVADGWTVEQQPDLGGDVALALRTTFDGPEQFASRTDGMLDALDEDDGRIWDGLRLAVDDEGVQFTGRAGLLVPRFPGADGAVQFDEDDLARLIRDRGDEFVTYELRLTLPGDVLDHDADRVDGASLVWDLPVGELREVSASSRFAVAGTPLLLTAIALLVATGTAVSIVVVRARRSAAMRREARRRVGVEST